MTDGSNCNAGRLNRAQLGHLRRIFQLAAQPEDDWSGMMGRSTLQEDFGSYRFQLAYMAYTLALAHIHRLPAAPGLFRRPFVRLLEKLRSPDVWTYWHYVSTGNGPLNSALGELPAQWDPVIKDNIMYSAYLQSVALLFHYLFDDDRYTRPGALSLVMKPLYWGAEKRFDYDERSLNEHLYWSMVERGYLGIACEPNCVFQICNQVPIIGFRLHDIVHGGDLAGEVTRGYLKAWEEFGLVNANGHFNMLVLERERVVVTPEAPWNDFWLGALMHAWNPEVVEASYPKQIERWGRPGPDGTLWIDLPARVTESANTSSARDFGWAAVCASEVGDADTLTGLLGFADRFLHPVWDRGALLYRRHDELFDSRGVFSAMDPHTGNVLLGYARLNVPNGLRKLYSQPWGAEHFAAAALDEVSDWVDVCTAYYSAIDRRLTLAVAPSEPSSKPGRLELTNIWGRGAWELRSAGELLAASTGDAVRQVQPNIRAAREEDRLVIELPLDGPTNLEVQWS